MPDVTSGTAAGTLRGPEGRDGLACEPGSVTCGSCPPQGSDHPSRSTVAGTLKRPTRTLGRAALERALSGLAPSGVYRAAPVTRGAGGLLHHRFTLTRSCPEGNPGGLFSVALACGLPRVGVTHHSALRSPDFPRRAADRLLPAAAPTRSPGQPIPPKDTSSGTRRAHRLYRFAPLPRGWVSSDGADPASPVRRKDGRHRRPSV